MEIIISFIAILLIVYLIYSYGYERGFSRGWDAKCEACKQMHEEEEGENNNER